MSVVMLILILLAAAAVLGGAVGLFVAIGITIYSVVEACVSPRS
jgi:hypothetical protein